MDENVRGRTIGQRIFSEIDDNPYLNKLYSGLLYNYAIKLFKLTWVEERPVKLMFGLPTYFPNLMIRRKPNRTTHGRRK